MRRSPEQERPAKRGGGLTREAHKAELRRLQPDGSEGTLLAARPSEVGEKVQALLGFSADQFRQVVVLPQGQFQNFLHSTDKDREAILEVLFNTEFYRRVEEHLKEKAKIIPGRRSCASPESITPPGRRIPGCNPPGYRRPERIPQLRIMDHKIGF